LSKSTFLKEFFDKKGIVGSVVPSSRFLIQMMLRRIDFENTKLIVELGPGTGVITDEIIKQLKPNSQLLVIELNDTFYKNLKTRISDPRVLIKKGCATDLPRFINALGIEKSDYIVSSLPLAILPHILRKRIVLDISTHLKPSGSFIQFQYTLQSLKLFNKYLKKYLLSIVY
jgi:phospholipid N-methyltransferase